MEERIQLTPFPAFLHSLPFALKHMGREQKEDGGGA